MFDVREWEARLEPWTDMQGHMIFLREIAAGRAEPAVIELGVRGGQSTACFLAGTAASGGEVWSVDADPPGVPAHWHDLPAWHFLQADDTSVQAQEWLPAQCDILFIDTCHEYGHTLAELRLYMPRVRAGGIVLLHDTEWDGTPENCRMLDNPGGPVTAALNTFAAEAGVTWENRPGCYGIGMIRR